MKKLLLPVGLLGLLFLGTAFASFKYFSRNKDSSIISPIQSTVTPTPTIPSQPGVYTALFLGQGDPSHEGSNLTDSIMAVSLNTTNKTIALIFIPRDLWVPLPQNIEGKSKIKINEAYSLGGLDLIKQTASISIDLPINFAILIDFNYFTQIIDLLGGIDITINKTFDDYYYPIAGKELDSCEKAPEELAAINATMSGFLLEKQYLCRYEHLHFDAGKTHVDGATALKFARSRHSDQDGGDFGRGLRQQALLIGIKNQLITLDALKNIEIGKFMVEGLSAVPAGSEIICKFQLDLNGILHVYAEEKQSGLKKSISIENAFSHFDKNEIHESKMKVSAMFGKPVEEPEPLPEHSEVISESGRLIKQAQSKLDGVTDEDRIMLNKLIESAEGAVSNNDENALVEINKELSELLFYLED